MIAEESDVMCPFARVDVCVVYPLHVLLTLRNTEVMKTVANWRVSIIGFFERRARAGGVGAVVFDLGNFVPDCEHAF